MTCADFDKAFKAAEQQLSDSLIKRKYKLRNTYWGKVKDGGAFPRNSGTSIKKIRLSRIGFGKLEVGWEAIQDDGCTTNLCSQPERETITRGWEESFYSIERFGMATDDICLTVLPFREMPEEELMHFEAGIGDFSTYAWEEFAKSRQIHLSSNKMAVVVPDNLVASSGVCDIVKTACNPDIKMDAFVFWHRNVDAASTATGAGPIDERYVSVNVDPTKINNISELTCDLLDVAAERLELEDENMRFLDEGIELFDVVLANNRMGARMAQIERLDESSCLTTVYDAALLKKTLGTRRIFRDRYSIRYDTYAMRFYPDFAYNANTLPGLGAYSPTNPDTWPRFVRVLPQIPMVNSNGTVRYDLNTDYIKAPFGISVMFVPTVFKIRGFPETQNIGSATKGETARNYAGKVVWINEYDKVCNPRRETGHWELDFGAAAEPDRPEFGFVYFHRIDHTIALVNNSCAIAEQVCNEATTISCYTTAMSGETIAANAKGANFPDHRNSAKYFY